MTHYVAAAPGTYLLVNVGEEKSRTVYDYIPVVAWEVSDLSPIPVPASATGAETFLGVRFSDGMVLELDTDRLHPNETAFAAALKAQRRTGAEAVAAHTAADAPSAPTGSQGEDAPTLRSLGISGRACAPLERMNVTTLADLSAYEKSEIAEIKGVSTDSVAQMTQALRKAGLDWAQPEGEAPPVEPEDSDDDGVGDVL